jgi:hypothetical protein
LGTEHLAELTLPILEQISIHRGLDFEFRESAAEFGLHHISDGVSMGGAAQVSQSACDIRLADGSFAVSVVRKIVNLVHRAEVPFP